MTDGGIGSRGNVNQAARALAPGSVVAEFDFAHALDDGSPEISEDNERLAGHDGFVEHFPNHGQLNERAGTALAGDEAVTEADQLEEAILPGVYAHFDVDPSIGFGRKKFRGDAVSFATGIFRAPRDRGHNAAISAGANGKTSSGEGAAKRARLFVIRVALEWA